MEQSDKVVVHKLKKIAIISFIFMTIEILGGALAGSIAIMADAFHLLSDVIAYVISLYAVLLSKRIAPKHFAFGYQKAQPMGALINVAIIWIVTIELFIEATNRIISKQVVKQPLYMLLTSVFGLGCNLYIMRVLHSSQDGHCGHSHGNSHGQSGQQHVQMVQELEFQKTRAIADDIQINCSCNSPDEMNRTTKHSEEKQKQKNQDYKQIESPLKMRLSEGLVPKRKGYCSLHSQDKSSPTYQQHNNGQTHDHNSDHSHSADHHGHNHKHDHKNNHKHDHNHNNKHDHKHDHDHNHDHHHDHYHDHDHGHKHGNGQHDHHHGKFFENINIQAAYIHIISDIILSIGVIVSATIIYFLAGNDQEWTAWQLADPFCTYFFSFVALYSTISIIKESILILMGGCQSTKLIKDTDEFMEELKMNHSNLQIEEVKVWSSNRGKHYCIVKGALRRKLIILAELKQQNQTQRQQNEIESIYKQIEKYCKSRKMISYIDVRR